MTTLAQIVDRIVTDAILRMDRDGPDVAIKSSIYAGIEEALKLEPTMGQWDDFCAVFPVPFDEFMKAYRAMCAARWKEIEESLK